VSSLRPAVVARLDGIVGAMQAHGTSALDARRAALRAVAGAVIRQGTVLAFEKTFLLQGLVFSPSCRFSFFCEWARAPRPTSSI